ncbi:MAG: nucleotidyl transferase AbiEii/AbiGii toxin family protein [Thermosynechococcaceae cyanobacterium]
MSLASKSASLEKLAITACPLPLNVSENKAFIEKIAGQLGVKEAFIEKELYAMHLIGCLTEIDHPKIDLVFAGGTSLSKAHEIIARFSEDLDFKVSLKQEVTRKERREFREQVIEAINKTEHLSVIPETVRSRNSSRFFNIQVLYPKVLPPSDALRPYIQLEVTFEQPTLQPQNQPLISFVAKAKGEAPEVESIPCVSTRETAADKLSALTWRVLDRDRSQPNDDATLVRHLHDLSALFNAGAVSEEFNDLALSCLEKDTARSKTITETLSPVERMQQMLQTLKTDPLYKEEFAQFVVDMSYAPDNARPSFDEAMHKLERVVEQVSDRHKEKQAETEESSAEQELDSDEIDLG